MSSLIAPVCLLVGIAVGIALGWILFKSKWTYEEVFRDGERYGFTKGFAAALQKTTKYYLLNPQTGDWYYH
jgi:hypothetical protein